MTTPTKGTRRLLLVASALTMAGLFTAGCHVSPKAPEHVFSDDGAADFQLSHRLRNGPEHDAALQRTGNPYVLEVKTEAGGALLYYGARHSRDGGDPQIADIIQRWDGFGPTVALYFFLRVYSSEAGGEADESLARDLLAKRTDVDGLRDSLETLAAVDTLWSRDFPNQPDWRVLQGERVFAVVGSGHVIRQEWALRSALGAEPAWDQPGAGEG